MEIIDLSGKWTCSLPFAEAEVSLPGTLDRSGLGLPDDPNRQWKVEEVRRIGFWQEGEPIVTRLTRLHTYEGKALFSRKVCWQVPQGKRIFAEVERARCLSLTVNGRTAPLLPGASPSTPWVFEVTGLCTGEDEFTFCSDNSYPGMARDDIVYSSAASDETQTNWNGLLGWIRIRVEEAAFVEAVRVYPAGDTLDVCVRLNCAEPWKGRLQAASQALCSSAEVTVRADQGITEVWLRTLPVREDALRWDLEAGNLCELTVSPDGMDSSSAAFGLRRFASEAGSLTLNGRKIFLRGEANCAAFPETGHPPMEIGAWKEILQRYQNYGANFVRFHSHCPPEAAFTAADELGMLLEPELSHWNPENAFATEESRNCYRQELTAILSRLANHPSFVMLSLGNELHADEAGHAYMTELLRLARDMDPTRLYANGSNTHYGHLGPDPDSDFFTAANCWQLPMRATGANMHGWLNQGPPDADHDYQPTVEAIRKVSAQPIFSFEVGQYEVLPDFDEIADYRGVTRAENLCHIRRKVEAAGLMPVWKQWVEATGELSLKCYRAEVEAALATKGYSGICLLSLQDFPGQGTALIGMMNAHLQPKPYPFAQPERFRAFFRDALPLLRLPRFTYQAGEEAAAPLLLANYSRETVEGSVAWKLQGKRFHAMGQLMPCRCAPGTLSKLGEIHLRLPEVAMAEKLTMTVRAGACENTYSLWVYPAVQPVCPPDVYECRALTTEAKAVLERGGKVYLAPDSTAEALPRSVQAHFSSDFWSVCTFPTQDGTMGQYINSSHPVFRSFPTEAHTDWQWWRMATQRAAVLPGYMDCIVAEMDSYAYLRPMAQLLECCCGNGRLMLSTMALHTLQDYPEARTLQDAIYRYMASDSFQPVQEMDIEDIAAIAPERA